MGTQVKNTVYTKREIIRQVTLRTMYDLPMVKNVYNALGDVIENLLLTARANNEVTLKMFNGLSLTGKCIPEKTKKNNLTGRTIQVPSKVKVKMVTSREFCERMNENFRCQLNTEASLA